MENNKSDDLEKSLTLRINNRGPNIDPCGTPCVMFLMLELIPLYCDMQISKSEKNLPPPPPPTN